MEQDYLVQQVREAVLGQSGTRSEGFEIKISNATETQCAYTGARRKRDTFTPGFMMDPNDPLIRVAASAVGKQRGPGSADIRPWAFATDGGWTNGVFGIPTLGFAPGLEGFAHTNTERLAIEDARWAFSKHPGLVLALQGELAS